MSSLRRQIQDGDIWVVMMDAPNFGMDNWMCILDYNLCR